MQEMTRKRRYGRLQKAMGDYSLLAGSPVDAADHYNTASELSRISSDFIWCAAAFIGLANAKVSPDNSATSSADTRCYD